MAYTWKLKPLACLYWTNTLTDCRYRICFCFFFSQCCRNINIKLDNTYRNLYVENQKSKAHQSLFSFCVLPCKRHEGRHWGRKLKVTTSKNWIDVAGNFLGEPSVCVRSERWSESKKELSRMSRLSQITCKALNANRHDHSQKNVENDRCKARLSSLFSLLDTKTTYPYGTDFQSCTIPLI